ncbi:histidine kinase [Myroides sp. LJL119]
MALYYDLGPLCQVYNDDKVKVKQRLIFFLAESKSSLEFIAQGIREKDYNKVREQLEILKPTLEFLGIDQAIEECVLIEAWTKDKGKIKEVKENFRSFKYHLKNATKEISKDFSLK